MDTFDVDTLAEALVAAEQGRLTELPTDLAMMQLALAQGEQARLLAPPNPWVGCVIAQGAVVVGQGHTQPPGQPHAERMALLAAGAGAQGATLYVTLEPCIHWGRTPPCHEAIIQAGIARVVVALLDPDTRMAGKGMAALQRAGIAVDLGVGATEATRSLEPYLHQRRTERPLCLLKAAISLDGRLAARDGSSQWITDTAARLDAHKWRAYSQAIAVGAGTARADLPQLTVRHPTLQPLTPPLRVLFDARGTVTASGPLFDGSAPTLICTTECTPQLILRQWRAAGVDVEVLPGSATDGVDLDAALLALGRRGVLQLLVEGGAALHGAFLQAQLAQRFICYIGNTLLGPAGWPLYRGSSPAHIDLAPRMTLEECYRCGDSACLVWRL